MSVREGIGRVIGVTKRTAARARDVFPVTWLGLVLAPAAFFALTRYAFGELDLVLLVLGWGAAGLLGLAFLIVVIAALALAFVLRRVPPRGAMTCETGTYLPSGFSLPTLAWAPLLAIDSTIVEPAGVTVRHVREGFRMHEQIMPNERGEHARVVRRVVVGDVFGLARVALRVVDDTPLRAVPHTGGLRQLPTLRSMASGDATSHPLGVEDGDRVDIRRYVAGDPARFIHWKAFGRTRKLMVRMPERAIAPSRRVVAYLVSGTGDEPSAGAARAALLSGAFGPDWTFGADGTPTGVRSVDEAVDLVVRSASARADAARGLPRFLEQADRQGPAGVVLFVPCQPGPWLDVVAGVVAERRTAVRVIVGVDGVAPDSRAPLLTRLALAPGSARGASVDALETLLGRLASVKAEVVVVDRGSGHVLVTPGAVRPDLRALAGRAA